MLARGRQLSPPPTTSLIFIVPSADAGAADRGWMVDVVRHGSCRSAHPSSVMFDSNDQVNDYTSSKAYPDSRGSIYAGIVDTELDL